MARSKRVLQASPDRAEGQWTQLWSPGHGYGAGSDVPVKKRRVDMSAPARAVQHAAYSPTVVALHDIRHPTPDPSALAGHVFPFLKLPAELRLNIYRCAMCSREPLLLDLAPKDDKDNDETIPQPSSLGPSHDDANANANVNIALLRTCSLVYKEARKVLYSENNFTLSIASSVAALAQLHQRSRSLIKSVTLAIPSHHDILDSFADLVRLGLRYCWGLKTFAIKLEIMLPDFDTLPAGHHGGIYANAFRILRWLPKGCKVILEGNVNESVKRIVAEEGRLLEELDEVS